MSLFWSMAAMLGQLRRRRAYAPTSNTASQDNHEKINSWVSFIFPLHDEYGAPLGGPLGRRSSAKISSFCYHLKGAEMKITSICPFLRVSQKSLKKLRVYMVLGDAASTLEKFVWILSHISRSITWSLFTLKA